jgi:hypothetical protein
MEGSTQHCLIICFTLPRGVATGTRRPHCENRSKNTIPPIFAEKERDTTTSISENLPNGACYTAYLRIRMNGVSWKFNLYDLKQNGSSNCADRNVSELR